ncbi:MAG: hypothetical protein K0U37_05210 [Gammaproteobacteria bacterium]|nr:hypothetical protein [Gammaproteobacteria bacterium]
MKLNILLLCNKPSVGQGANTVVDHIEAFEQYSEHHIYVYSNLGSFSKKLDLSKFDVVIIHYSLSVLSRKYLTRSAKKKLHDYTGMKVIFIQDEYRRINDVVSELQYLGIDILFTCFPESEFENIYPKHQLPFLSKYNNLTGYVPQRLTEYTKQPPMGARPVHVGYRGRRLPYWYGALGFEKSNIVEKWHEHVPVKIVNTDISFKETDRIYGHQWSDFLSSCKATLGVESGVSVMDFTGELEKKVDTHELMHPEDSFEIVQKKYFLKEEGLHQLNQISPRCFEAIALKTVLVLYEGDYSGILIPGRHYIALKKDFSNISEVLSLLKDDNFLQNMADIAYKEIALNPKYTYQTFIKKVDSILQHEFVERDKKCVSSPYSAALFHSKMGRLSFKNKVMMRVMSIYQGLPFGMRLKIKGMLRIKKTSLLPRFFYRKQSTSKI